MAHIDENTVMWNESEDIVTVLVIGSGEFVELNSVGSTIWKLIAEGKSEREIVDVLADTYDAPRSVLEKDLRTFIDHMIKRELLAA